MSRDAFLAISRQKKKKALLPSWDFKSLPERVSVFSSIITGNVNRLVSPEHRKNFLYTISFPLFIPSNKLISALLCLKVDIPQLLLPLTHHPRGNLRLKNGAIDF